MAMTRRSHLRRFVALGALLALVVVVALVGMTALPPLLLRDAPVPANIAPYIADARARLFGEAFRLPLPVHLRFVGARCRREGGALLVFEQWKAPYLGTRYAYAMSGTWPPTEWGGGYGGDGGYGMTDLSNDPEIAASMVLGEVPCG